MVHKYEIPIYSGIDELLPQVCGDIGYFIWFSTIMEFLWIESLTQVFSFRNIILQKRILFCRSGELLGKSSSISCSIFILSLIILWFPEENFFDRFKNLSIEVNLIWVIMYVRDLVMINSLRQDLKTGSSQNSGFSQQDSENFWKVIRLIIHSTQWEMSDPQSFNIGYNWNKFISTSFS